MIYLIDDKVIRRTDYGWPESRFEPFKDFVRVITDIKMFREYERWYGEKGSLVLFHDSFFDNPEHARTCDSRMEKERLIERFSATSASIVIFSGAIQRRKVDGNQAFAPVDSVYANLENLLKRAKGADNDLINEAVFGEMSRREELLRAKMELWTNMYSLSNDSNFEFKPVFRKSLQLIKEKVAKTIDYNGVIGYIKWQIGRNRL